MTHRTKLRRGIRSLVGVAAAALLVFGTLNTGAAAPAAAIGATHQPISGIGSSWSANALQQWIRNVGNNYGWTITYDDRGSTAGRQGFADGSYDFAVSEIPWELKDSDIVDPRPARGFAYMPIVAGGTAIMYNLVVGGSRVTNLRLSGETLTKIFTGVVTTWNDPAIAADNPSIALPAIPIIPVVRSDGSGTTAQFTSWMRKQYPALYTEFCARVGKANCGITSNFPFVQGSAFIAQNGSNGVAGYVAQEQYVGAITYVEYSYALNSGMPVAKLLNAADYYTEPTAQNVAVSLLGAQINQDAASPDYLTQDLTNVYNNADPRTYPMSSYSYMIIPTRVEGRFTEDKGLTLGDFSQYFLCEGQQQAEVLGYSPLPINLAAAGLDQVQRIPGADPTGKDITACNNPTFSPDGTNRLANEAPFPSECDKRGATQCADGTGGAKGSTNASTAGDATAAAAGQADAAASPSAAAPGAETALDPNAKPIVVNAVPTAIDPIRRLTAPSVVATVLALLLLAGLVVPPWWAKRRRAQAAGADAGAATGAAAEPVERPSRTPAEALRNVTARVRSPFTRRESKSDASGDHTP
ncbi:phosphate ABC transporter substrate-binding protein PstS [Agromyces sp. Soil535]|uniref:phosphate ABC transporter substrate-binding protein PstS n=1 Tax=Agromyces sp. Soil535 TaxID=1736390 RepID=UPI000A7BF38C|nr:phosphate ABC transporter substrate-binding protein PstS [Agromyces sp. Soil535]